MKNKIEYELRLHIEVFIRTLEKEVIKETKTDYQKGTKDAFLKCLSLFKGIQASIKTYELIKEKGKIIAIRCKLCNMTSYNDNDIKCLFCAYCNEFHKHF